MIFSCFPRAVNLNEAEGISQTPVVLSAPSKDNDLIQALHRTSLRFRMKQLLLFLLVWMSLSESMSARPNLVLIFIDDMGYGDIGPFGSQLNRTPHLDRMAKEGRKLTSFYAAPVCSASRAQLLTGCYAPRVVVPGVFSPPAGMA